MGGAEGKPELLQRVSDFHAGRWEALLGRARALQPGARSSEPPTSAQLRKPGAGPPPSAHALDHAGPSRVFISVPCARSLPAAGAIACCLISFVLSLPSPSVFSSCAACASLCLLLSAPAGAVAFWTPSATIVQPAPGQVCSGGAGVRWSVRPHAFSEKLEPESPPTHALRT